MTIHNNAEKEDIASLVLMPGDTLRCKMIADNFLSDVKQVNTVRGMYGYTGNYKGKRVTVFPSGMGCPSMGIYSYELFNDYGVEKIIRVGSCGTYDEEINLFELILVNNSYSTSDYLRELTGRNDRLIASDLELNENIIKTADKMNISFNMGNVYCSDAFYRDLSDIDELHDKMGCLAEEMETFALFSNAKTLGKKAAAILTVSDNMKTKAKASSEERQNSFKQMVELALESI